MELNTLKCPLNILIFEVKIIPVIPIISLLCGIILIFMRNEMETF
jgi:hypothetical protein